MIERQTSPVDSSAELHHLEQAYLIQGTQWYHPPFEGQPTLDKVIFQHCRQLIINPLSIPTANAKLT